MSAILQRERKSSSIFNYCFFIQRKQVIEASPVAIWNIISNVQTYDQWCDFKLAGMIFQDAQVFMHSREAPNNAAGTRLRVSKLIEPDMIEFSYGRWSSWISFELQQRDENETEIVYKRANVYWLLPLFLFAYTFLITASIMDDAPDQFLLGFNMFMAILSIILFWKSISNVSSRMEGSLVNLKHIVTTSPSSQGGSVIIEAENVRATSVAPLEVQSPLNIHKV